jgi:hypothetical protein
MMIRVDRISQRDTCTQSRRSNRTLFQTAATFFDGTWALTLDLM